MALGAEPDPCASRCARSPSVVDVEAVLQEALLRVWQVAPRFDCATAEPNGLLRLGIRIARNLAVSEVRRTQARPTEEGDLEAALGETRPLRRTTPDPMLRGTIASAGTSCREARQALDTRLASGGASPTSGSRRRSVGMRLNTFLQNFTRARKLLADCLRKHGIQIEELGP